MFLNKLNTNLGKLNPLTEITKITNSTFVFVNNVEQENVIEEKNQLDLEHVVNAPVFDPETMFENSGVILGFDEDYGEPPEEYENTQLGETSSSQLESELSSNNESDAPIDNEPNTLTSNAQNVDAVKDILSNEQNSKPSSLDFLQNEQTRRDDAASLSKEEINRIQEYKKRKKQIVTEANEKLGSKKSNEPETVKKLDWKQVKKWFRYNALLWQAPTDKLFHPFNVILSLGLLYGFYRLLEGYLNQYGAIFYFCTVLFSVFVVYGIKPAIPLLWQRKFNLKSVKESFGVDEKLMLAAVLLLGSFAYLFDSGLLLFFGVSVAIVLLTKRHFFASMIGVFCTVLVFITPVQVVYWDSMIVKQTRLVTSHLRRSQEVEQIPEVFKATIKDVYVLPADNFPVYYTYDVYIKPTKSLIYSLKYSKCKKNGGLNCEKLGEPTHNDLWNILIFNNQYLITNFADYQLFVAAVLKPQIKSIMVRDVTFLTLPIREADYKLLLPPKIEAELKKNGLKVLGNPDIKLSLQSLGLLNGK